MEPHAAGRGAFPQLLMPPEARALSRTKGAAIKEHPAQKRFYERNPAPFSEPRFLS